MVDQRGIFGGTSPTKFSPEEPITRAQFVTTLGRIRNIKQDYYSGGWTPFWDINRNDYYYPYLVWAYQNKIVDGTTPNTFEPNTPVQRQDVCVMLMRYIEYGGMEGKKIQLIYNKPKVTFADDWSIGYWARDAVYKLQQASLISGTGSNYFNPTASMTRAEACTIVYNLYMNYLNAYYHNYSAKSTTLALRGTNSFVNLNSPSWGNILLDYGSKVVLPFKNKFNISMYYTTGVIPITLPEDSCPQGLWRQCTNSCSSVCAQHHKSFDRELEHLKVNWKAMNSLNVVLSAANLCYNGSHDDRYYGLSNLNGKMAIVRFFSGIRPIDKIDGYRFGNIRTIQHEISHLYGVPDGGCNANESCIMNGGFDHNQTFALGNLWCSNCVAKFNRNLH